MSTNDALFEYLLRIADDHLILAHRLSQWCGHAPTLEEDLALPNIALDLMGQARTAYTYAGEVEGAGRDEDKLAYLRLEREYKNLLLVERNNGDFAHTLVRQLFFSVYMKHLWRNLLSSQDQTLSAMADKASKETTYHVRYASEWVIRLGDGSQISTQRTIDAIEALTPYIEELFVDDEVTQIIKNNEIGAHNTSLRTAWLEDINTVLQQAQLARIEDIPIGITGGRQGRHGEEMGYLLNELQYMQRTFPDMTW